MRDKLKQNCLKNNESVVIRGSWGVPNILIKPFLEIRRSGDHKRSQDTTDANKSQWPAYTKQDQIVIVYVSDSFIKKFWGI